MIQNKNIKKWSEEVILKIFNVIVYIKTEIIKNQYLGVNSFFMIFLFNT